MDREQRWQAIEQERLSLAALLDTLTDDEWDRPSLCEGWRVRDVAAHVSLAPQPPGMLDMAVWAVRARGRFHRLNHDISVAHANARPGAGLAADLRTHAASRRLPPFTGSRNILFDTLVHAQDIAIPLQRAHPMPVAAAAEGATRVWTMGWPFWARRRLAGYRLMATDVEWSVGAGPREVCGPIEALLLLLTGRTAALDRLSGPDATTLTAKLGERHRA
jgi:uncharacterized protein (TIGR03083 family)